MPRESVAVARRKLREFAEQHLGNVGLVDAEQSDRLDLLQASLYQQRINLEDKLRLDRVLIRVRPTILLDNPPAQC